MSLYMHLKEKERKNCHRCSGSRADAMKSVETVQNKKLRD